MQKCAHILTAVTQVFLQAYKKTIEDAHLSIKIYWILPDTPKSSTTVITLICINIPWIKKDGGYLIMVIGEIFANGSKSHYSDFYTLHTGGPIFSYSKILAKCLDYFYYLSKIFQKQMILIMKFLGFAVYFSDFMFTN